MSEDVFRGFLDPNGEPQNCIADCQSPSDWLIFAWITKTLKYDQTHNQICPTFWNLRFWLTVILLRNFWKIHYIILITYTDILTSPFNIISDKLSKGTSNKWLTYINVPTVIIANSKFNETNGNNTRCTNKKTPFHYLLFSFLHFTRIRNKRICVQPEAVFR